MSSTTSNRAALVAFTRTVWRYYDRYGRHDLPWRQTRIPYRILVSELMLQQTQVARVIPKYLVFIATFPTPRSLAEAPLAAVLRLWQGLGYNRRAKFLHEAAKVIAREGFPTAYEGIRQLPGVGSYTAGAILAFAYKKSVPVIETNIRTVYLHHFFSNETDVSDADILALVSETLPKRRSVREWYYALMDYGAHLKVEVGNKNSKSRHYTVQSRFAGSDRQLRGAIIRLLAKGGGTVRALSAALPKSDPERLAVQLVRLQAEGLVVKVGRRYELPT